MHEWTILTEGNPPYTGCKVTIIKSKRHHAFRLVKSLGFLAATPIVLFIMLYLIFIIGDIAGVPSEGFGDLIDLVLNMPNTWRLLGIFANTGKRFQAILEVRSVVQPNGDNFTRIKTIPHDLKARSSHIVFAAKA